MWSNCLLDLGTDFLVGLGCFPHEKPAVTVVLPNPQRMLGVLGFPLSTEL